jgi:uncharacterized repeat protein (TIGR02543 family)
MLKSFDGEGWIMKIRPSNYFSGIAFAVAALFVLFASCSSPVASIPATETTTGQSSGTTGGTTANSANWSWTVTFVATDATTAASVTSMPVVAPTTTTTTLPVAPKKNGYAFAGWWTAPDGKGTEFTATTPVTSDITVYAKWATYSYTVSFDLRGATSPESIPPIKIESPAYETGTLQTPLRTSYYFAGWWTETNGGGTEFTATTPVTSDITVYAKWSAKPVYQVLFIDIDGKFLSMEDVVEGDAAVAPDPAPTKDGCIFDNWYTDKTYATAWDFTTPITASTRIYADWKAPVTFYPEEGTGTMEAQYIRAGGNRTLNANTFTREGYTFVGWRQEKHARITYTDKATITDFEGSISLYACWNPIGSVSENELTYTTDYQPSITGFTGTESEVIIPNWVNGYKIVYLAKSAFANNTTITSVLIPETVVGWNEDSIFEGCTNLISVTSLSRSRITGRMFYGCTKLESVKLLSRTSSIYESAFENCTSLKSIVIPSSVEWIYGSAFKNCTSLESIEIPSSVKQIYGNAFENCTSLTSIEIPTSITAIGGDVFSGCSSLSSITIPESIKSIDYYTFRNCTGLKSVTIPSSVTSIKGGSFYGCANLSSIEIPSSVTSLEDYTFYGCTSLSSVKIPESISSISTRAFDGCTSLTSITIPASVTSIGTEAFANCTNLALITVNATKPPALENSHSFWKTSKDLQIKVPADSVAAYQSSWSDFKDCISAITP